MNEGNNLRKKTGENAVFALAISSLVNNLRTAGNTGELSPLDRTAFVVHSLKHPEEIEKLRETYSVGLYVVGVFADRKSRLKALTLKGMTPEQAEILIDRDEGEKVAYGQKTRDAFQRSDFFVSFDSDIAALQNQLLRILDAIFGYPYLSPTFDEFAMFMAFSSALRSADLSRQVGAVITKDQSIIATGANDIPRAGGGLYWPEVDGSFEITDSPNGRDYCRGKDSNKEEKIKIVDDIAQRLIDEGLVAASCGESVRKILEKSRIKDITEYGRVVHAEMEAILAAGRQGISLKGTTLFCTTFPCHNCTKHLIAAGIARVVYVEPYPKSKAFEFHDDAICEGGNSVSEKVVFEPFMGIGARNFFNLFSMTMGRGIKLERKNSEGRIRDWAREAADIRVPNFYISLFDRELSDEQYLKDLLKLVET
ncbi:CMP/dCMP-type deaminase domain-containing protein [Acanthopleuribacter pedis]